MKSIKRIHPTWQVMEDCNTDFHILGKYQYLYGEDDERYSADLIRIRTLMSDGFEWEILYRENKEGCEAIVEKFNTKKEAEKWLQERVSKLTDR